MQGAPRQPAANNETLSNKKPPAAPFGVRADGKPRRTPRPYAGETATDPDPQPAGGADLHEPARASAAVFLAPALRAERDASTETQRERSVRLLADDRSEHLVPSIRHAEISVDLPDGGTRVLRPPSVQKTDWRDPNDTTPNASKSPRRVKGTRRSNTLAWMQKRGTAITADQVTAGAIYEADFELSHYGHFPGAPPPEVRGSPGPGDYSRSIDCGRAFRAAEKAVGYLGADLLRHVLLGREGTPPSDISSWAASKSFGGKQLGREAAVGMLIITLETLVVYYGRRIRDRQKDDA